MRILKIRRIKKFASALMPYWIVAYSQQQFKDAFGMKENLSCIIDNFTGQPYKRADFNPDDFGVRIKNGQILELKIEDDVRSFFVMTYEGLLSNEIILNPDYHEYNFDIVTKGGWRFPSYPTVRASE